MQGLADVLAQAVAAGGSGRGGGGGRDGGDGSSAHAHTHVATSSDASNDGNFHRPEISCEERLRHRQPRNNL